VRFASKWLDRSPLRLRLLRAQLVELLGRGDLPQRPLVLSLGESEVLLRPEGLGLVGFERLAQIDGGHQAASAGRSSA
jgi:hypothetical protein